jgi:hypothetical protein
MKVGEPLEMVSAGSGGLRSVRQRVCPVPTATGPACQASRWISIETAVSAVMSGRARRHRQACRDQAAWAWRMAAAPPAAAARPGDPVATPRESGPRPGVATVDLPRGDIPPWAAGVHVGGRDHAGARRARVVAGPGVPWER